MIDYSSNGHRITVEKCDTPVKATIDGEEIASTGSALILREDGYQPVYYFPYSSVKEGILRDSAKKTTCPYKGHARYYGIELGDKGYSDSVWRYLDAFPDFEPIKDYVAFYGNVVSVSEQ